MVKKTCELNVENLTKVKKRVFLSFDLRSISVS